jgi:hypothetical protein
VLQLRPPGLLVEGCGKGGDAGQIGLGVRAGGDAVLAVEEVRDRLVDARQLAHRVWRREEAAAIRDVIAGDDRVAEHLKGVAIDLVGRAHGCTVESLELLDGAPHERLVRFHLVDRAVVQTGLHRRVLTAVEAEGCKRLRRGEQQVPSQAVHEGVQRRSGILPRPGRDRHS